jgi:hypothetical protein
MVVIEAHAARSTSRKVAPRKPTMFASPTAFPISESAMPPTTPLSPMSLCDRLITLAKDADSAGYQVTADQLVRLAITIFDEAPRRPD